MLGKTAKKYFLGQGVARLGCAQSVAEALRELYGLDDAFVTAMNGATGGRAPLGYCGAIHAALRVVEEKGLSKRQEIEDFFKKEAGGLICRDIRSRGQLMCADCVEQAANLLSGDSSEK